MAFHSIKKKNNNNNKQKFIIHSKRIWMLLRLLTIPVQLRPSPVYPGLHVQTCDPFVLLQVAFTWHLPWFVSHSSMSVKKKKMRKEWKMRFGFYSRVIYVHVWKKSHTRLYFSGFMRFSDWTNKWNHYFWFFSTLVQQILPIFSRYTKNTVRSFLENF